MSAEPCGLCGSDDVVAVAMVEVRRGTAWMNPRWRPSVRSYDVCRDCRAKHRTENGRRI